MLGPLLQIILKFLLPKMLSAVKSPSLTTDHSVPLGKGKVASIEQIKQQNLLFHVHPTF